ncbi:Protein FAR1-RELATED SEQUENCE [Arachis hypogaea]|nr:Protein FAR1-RELATED SEQUENCE [Arachis hypogaea]
MIWRSLLLAICDRLTKARKRSSEEELLADILDSPELTRSCSNLERRDILGNTIHQFPDSKSQSFENLQELTAGKVAANLESPRSRIYRNSPVEAYVGQEFESEAEAHAFYNAYATSVGFIVRVSKLSRSRIDNSAIGQIFVCNKEGYRMTDKRENVIRQRVKTRVGCKAMIMVRKVKSGSWVVTRFVKEHTHLLAGPGGGRRDFIYEQYPVSSPSSIAMHY